MPKIVQFKDKDGIVFPSGSTLVKKYSLPSDAQEFTINGLDIIKDGGIYEIIFVMATVGGVCHPSIRLNASSNYNYVKSGVEGFATSDGNSSGQLNSNSNWFYLNKGQHLIARVPAQYEVCVAKITIVRAYQYLIESEYSFVQNGNQAVGKFTGKGTNTAPPNLTSITFKGHEANFNAGSMVYIYRK